MNAYGDEVVPPRTGKPGRPKVPRMVPPANLKYATVHKTREKGRVVKIDYRVIFGTAEQIEQALAQSQVSNQINTTFVERHNGTDRNRNARKVRKTYCFSKDPDVHEAMTYFTLIGILISGSQSRKNASFQWCVCAKAAVAVFAHTHPGPVLRW